MKHWLTLLAFAVSLVGYAQKPLADSMQTYTKDLSGQWQHTTTTQYVYDVQGRIVYYRATDTDPFGADYICTQSYHPVTGEIASMEFYDPSTSPPDLTFYMRKHWIPVNAQGQGSVTTRYFNGADLSGEKDSIVQVFSQGGPHAGMPRQINVFDSSASASWTHRYSRMYTYEPDDRIAIIQVSKFSPSTGYVDSAMVDYEYYPDSLVTTTLLAAPAGGYENSSRINETFHPDSSYKSARSYRWVSGQGWVLQYHWVYDAVFGSQGQMLDYKYGFETGGQVDSLYWERYFYTPVTGIKPGTPAQGPRFRIGPNPGTDYLDLHTESDEAFVWELWSTDGKRLLHQVSQSRARLPLNQVSAGTYLLRLKGAGWSQQHRITKQ